MVAELGSRREKGERESKMRSAPSHTFDHGRAKTEGSAGLESRKERPARDECKVTQ